MQLSFGLLFRRQHVNVFFHFIIPDDKIIQLIHMLFNIDRVISLFNNREKQILKSI